MPKDIDKLKKSLEIQVQKNKIIEIGIDIMKKIIKNFDSISNKIEYSLSNDKFRELVKLNSKYFKNKTLRGLNKRGLRLSYIKEIIKQDVLQKFKKRNKKNWEDIRKIGLESMVVISWGVAVRRKAIPVFLNDDELHRYGYDSGLEDPQIDRISLEESKYYDDYVYPPFEPENYDERFEGVILTRGMRFQLIHLIEKSFKKYLEEVQLPEMELENILIEISKNPKLLQLIFEGVRHVETENMIKVQELERELLLIYENLSSEKKQETLERIKKTKVLKDVCKSIGYYTDIYLYANKLRRKGMPLDKAIRKGIEKYKNSNEYLICTFSRKAKQDFLEKGRKYVDKIKFKDVKNRKFAFNINNVK